MQKLMTMCATILALTTLTITTHAANPHATLTWKGPGTCLQCHTTKAKEVHASVHYQWKGASPAITNHTTTGGKNNGAMNAYCINITGNWNGCGSCHVGLGAMPTATATTAQLQNIDCLICHQEKYKRVKVNGIFQPDTAKMTITMDQAVQTLTRPTRAACLQCHAKGGGGDNFKRGDMALAHGSTTDRTFDVHMATTGANLSCTACHKTSAHKIAGRGTDLRPTDLATAVTCSTSTCHATKTNVTSGHSSSDISMHVGRVACQTCHVKTYARNALDTAATEATEMNRDWTTPVWSTTLNRYEPTITLANDQKPVYAFWSGKSWGYNVGDAAVIDPATGKYKISRPLGAITDAQPTKLYPFKYKTAMQPLATGLNKLVALDTSVYFSSGNYLSAVQQGMVNMGYNAGEPVKLVPTDEYQLITHEVMPKDNALTCNQCHTSTATQMKLPAMGYTLKAAATTVCTQCHEYESNPGFTKVHAIHVKDKKVDCSLCHKFSRPERGLSTAIIKGD